MSAPSDRRRWDTDDRFVGVADAGATAPDIERLLAMTVEPGWVTEDAVAHLGARCRTTAEALGLDVVRLGAIDDVLELDVRPRDRRDRGARRIAAFALVGAFAEGSTHIRERREGDSFVLDVVTGVLPGDGVFATHGHVARIRIFGPA